MKSCFFINMSIRPFLGIYGEKRAIFTKFSLFFSRENNFELLFSTFAILNFPRNDIKLRLL